MRRTLSSPGMTAMAKIQRSETWSSSSRIGDQRPEDRAERVHAAVQAEREALLGRTSCWRR